MRKLIGAALAVLALTTVAVARVQNSKIDAVPMEGFEVCASSSVDLNNTTASLVSNMVDLSSANVVEVCNFAASSTTFIHCGFTSSVTTVTTFGYLGRPIAGVGGCKEYHINPDKVQVYCMSQQTGSTSKAIISKCR